MLEKIIKASNKEFDINFCCCVSLPGYTWQCGLNYCNENIQPFQDKHMIP